METQCVTLEVLAGASGSTGETGASGQTGLTGELKQWLFMQIIAGMAGEDGFALRKGGM